MLSISNLFANEQAQETAARSLSQAFNLGEECAQKLAIGSAFLGARVEAINAGYSPNTGEFRCYLEGFIRTLNARFPHGVPTIHGRIVAA
jgi:hypothetical protein